MNCFQGVSPNAFGAGSAWGLYFFGYNFLKASMIDAQNVKSLSAGEHLLAGTIAGRCYELEVVEYSLALICASDSMFKC